MPFVIGAPCVDVNDQACIDECPVDCIYTGERMSYIQPIECIDCAACEPVCPVEAIRPGQRLDEEWVPFREAAKELFARVGSPGGSTKVDLPLADTQFVADFEKDED